MKYLKCEIGNGNNVYVMSAIDNDNNEENAEYEMFEEQIGDKVASAGIKLKNEVAKILPLLQDTVGIFSTQENGPDELEVEFGIALSASMGVVITSGEMETNLTIKATWKKE